MKKRALFIISIVLSIDLLSKFLVFKYVTFGSSKIIIKNFFKILPVKNTGAAFSFFDNNNILLILISLGILIYLIYYFRTIKSTFVSDFSCGLLIGGLLGNLFDRIFLSYVRDFFSFKLFKWNFAIFNVADIAIVIGAFILLLLLVKGCSKNDN